METITWHENMAFYYRNLHRVSTELGARIDPMMCNKALMEQERVYSDIFWQYWLQLDARLERT